MQKQKIILLVILAILLSWYGYQASKFFQGVLPFHAFDEYEYFLYARSFAETGSLKTPFLEQDSESILGQFGTHGFAYALLHGSINVLIGEHWWNIPLFNFSILIAAFIFIFLVNKRHKILKGEEQLLFLLLCLSCFLIAVYSFSFMQENIHLSFALVGCFLLHKTYTSPQKKSFLWAYIGLVIFASIFRTNWILWYWALLPRFIHKKAIFIAVGAVLMLIAAIYLRLIQATYVVGFLNQLSLKFTEEGLQKGFVFWIEHIIENFYTYFRWYVSLPFYFFTKYFIIGGSIFFLWKGFTQKNSLLMGLGLVALLQLSALFTIYDTVYWRDVRMLAPTLISLFFGLILFSKQWAQRVLIVQLGLFYFVINYTDGWVASHRKTYQAAQLNNYREDFIKVGKLVKGESIVMLRRSFAHEGQTYLFALPFKNTEGLPIRYSVYYAPLETAPNHLHDYMILPQKIFRDNNEIVLLEENATFNLYKVNKPILSRERSKN